MLRNQLGLDNNAMAARMNVSTWTYRSYKRGEHLPAVDNLGSLINTNNVSLDWLYSGRGHMFYLDAQQESERILEAERTAIEKEKAADSFQREMEEMKQVMQLVPIVKHQVMAYYQQVKEEQKEAIHREMETRAEGNKKTAASERVNYASGTGLSINKERETPNKINEIMDDGEPIHKEQAMPVPMKKERRKREPVIKKMETPDRIIKEPETPEPENQEPTKKPRPKVQSLFPKKRKSKRK
ncbi:MAG: helix-turn-helix domain-containing protein [bacterium]|nr:helix-turn-helix domain-containing protein [bacterium]